MKNIDYITLIGQIFGAIAVVLGFLSYQVSGRKRLLLLQFATSFVFCIHYLLIGAVSGFALNVVSVVRNLVYSNKDKKFFSSPAYPYIFAVIMAVLGALSWQGPVSLLIIAGLIVNTFGMSFKNPQNIRKSILVSSPLVLLYDILVMSVGGAVYESVVIVSSVIGIVRMRKKEL